MSYLASSDRERICRQFTTALASVPENSTAKICCQCRPTTQILSITFEYTHFQFTVKARFNIKSAT